MPVAIPLTFSALESFPRRGEPVTLGVPFPEGLLKDDSRLRLIGPDGKEQDLQTRTLSKWIDGSVRWCLVDFLAHWDGVTAASGYTLTTADTPRPAVTVMAPTASPTTMGLILKDAGGKQHDAPLRMNESPAEAGPLRTRDGIKPVTLAGLEIFGHYELHVRCGAIRFHLTVRNPNAAEHPGGNWDLGTAGTALFQAFTFIALYDGALETIALSTERGKRLAPAEACIIQQTASGGRNWKSANHLDKDRRIPMQINGYQVVKANSFSSGDRATPLAVLDGPAKHLAITMPYFWENFPKSLAVHPDRLQLDLFPFQEKQLHEIQGGEQKTFTFTVAYANTNITDDPLAWARSPITVTLPPERIADSSVIPYFIPKSQDSNHTYRKLVDQAVDGDDTFLNKRERIDEYGWRHFGDLWGDHEAVDHTGPEPMISHYNNQYDCVNGFLVQYLQSGDTRWLQQGLECADHTCDIDIYHTTHDKSAYNGGLFWHTYHYAPADTGTHRSYPRSLKNQKHFEGGQDLEKLGGTGAALKENYAVGGGPAAAHNYNTGLMLAYYMTGNPLYHDNAVGLAEYVLNVDDGTKTVFKWFCRGDTGLAIESSAGYSGPGRASGNSLNALLAGHELTGDAKYLAKAEQIIRRVVHPKQDLASLDLLNAELRWFYTMFLQALGRYLDYKVHLKQNDEAYAYAQSSLLHYAEWMAAHERPILDQPEKLQYPTETWAAQDMRKVEVFQYAARHSDGDARQRFLEKAEWFFRYVERTLDSFPPTKTGVATKSLCRPVILLMNFGWSRSWWRLHPDSRAPLPAVNLDVTKLGEWRMFTPQKPIAIRRAKRLALVSAVLFTWVVMALTVWLLFISSIAAD